MHLASYIKLHVCLTLAAYWKVTSASDTQNLRNILRLYQIVHCVMIRRVLNSSQPTLASMLLLQNTNSINDLPMTIPVKPFSNCTSVFAADDCNITWCTTCSLPQSVQHVVSLRVESKFVNFNSTLIICLKFVFIEMLDKLIRYIMFWYKTMYQVLPVSRTNCIPTRRYRDSQWYWFTQQAWPDTKSCTNTLCKQWVCISFHDHSASSQ